MTRDAVRKATLEQKIAQKIVLDFRFFDDENKTPAEKQALTQLPREIAELITTSNLGGVILFKENLRDIEQIIHLTRDLQRAALSSDLALPLFLSADHEGGRVTRLPEGIATSFSGNMSIGATFSQHDVTYAKLTGEVLAKELSVLGINVNHAPVVDVNADKANPVINSRAFSDDPKVVAKLAIAQVQHMQQQGVMATLKHFPGHGNTHIDSHTGLPCINYAKDIAEAIDIAPFRDVLSNLEPNQAPDMIMTAHIQYPALDDTLLLSKVGERIIAPATMSRRIIHDYLRTQLKYDGLIVSDALDMAGISDYFSETQAVINCFAAGIDIAVMPLRIRSKRDLDKLSQLISSVAEAVTKGIIDEQEINASFTRICNRKRKLPLPSPSSVSEHIVQAKSVVGCQRHRDIEQNLATSALSVIRGREQISDCLANKNHIHIMMPQRQMNDALKHALLTVDATYALTETDLQYEEPSVSKAQIDSADVVIAGHIFPKQSPVELGGIEDIENTAQHLDAQRDSRAHLQSLLEYAKSKSKKVIFVSLRTPYDIRFFSSLADIAIACYAYNVSDIDGQLHAPTFTALANVLSGKVVADGISPVALS